MESRIRWAIFSAFAALLFFSSCSEQPPLLVPVSTGALVPSATPTKTTTKTPRPTKTLYPTWTPRVTATATVVFPDPCTKNLVPAELLISQPTAENNKLIAFSRESRSFDTWRHLDIYTSALDGSRLKRLTYYSGDEKKPDWSPDGKKILFYSDRNRQPYLEGEPGYGMEPFKPELFVMNLDGTGTRKVTADSTYYPGRSPDGKYIAYTIDFYDELRLEHNLGDYLSNVLVENISGSYRKNITSDLQPGAFGGIDWSPDGKHFTFAGITPPTPIAGVYSYKLPVHIYLANADGSNLRKLDEGGVPRGESHSYQESAWSSDGKHLAFLTSNGIAIVKADGSSFVEYPIQNNVGSRDIYWSNDNQYLIFTDANDTFYKINADFTRLEKLPLVTDLEKLLYRMQLLKTRMLWERKSPYYYHYELSPNGKWLVYTETGINPNRCSQIRVVSVDTGENYLVLDRDELIPYLLKHSPNDELSILSVDFIFNWSRFNTILWSPDSSQLLFTHSYFGLNFAEYRDLFAINLDGTGLDLILDNVWDPAIQP